MAVSVINVMGEREREKRTKMYTGEVMRYNESLIWMIDYS